MTESSPPPQTTTKLFVGGNQNTIKFLSASITLTKVIVTITGEKHEYTTSIAKKLKIKKYVTHHLILGKGKEQFLQQNHELCFEQLVNQ